MYFSRLALLLAAFLCLSVPAFAQNQLGEPKVRAQLIAEQESIQPGKPFWVALRMEITPDWHVYWRNPGDSGMATRLSWDIPAGYQAGSIVWPTPSRIAIPPLLNYGYSNQVLLLIPITPPAQPTEPKVTLKAKADWLVCHEVCIPESADVSITLPVAEQKPMASAWSNAFTFTRKQVPHLFKGELKAEIKDAQHFDLTLRNLPLSGMDIPVEAYFYSGDPMLVQHAGPQTLSQNDRDITITVPFNETNKDRTKPIEGDVWVRTTQGDYSFAVTTSFPQPKPASPVATATSSASAPIAEKTTMGPGWLGALGLAFLGGLLLNLMPCVFPVLSIKALALLDKSHKDDKRSVRIGGLVYGAGVLSTFMALGIALLILQATGLTVGWGMQLQSPVFVTVMIIVLFLIGYSLIGAVTFGTRLMGVGQSLTHKSGHVGVFFTGALAVVVATPCTAPFMGGALFFAFTQSWYVSLTVLLALGIGLALPYMLLCFYPQALKILPKPGIWMEHVKQFFAFPMFAAAVWLVWVLAQQSGADGVLRALIAILSIAFALWVWNSVRHDTKQNLWHYTKIIITFIMLFYALALVIDQRTSEAPMTTTSTGAPTDMAIQAYSADTLAKLREEGRPVFVNMTAAWCITCLANEKNALSNPRVKEFFKKNNITYLKGDWTNQDPALSEFLAQHQRNGVPLYVFYPAGGPPKILPQLLTPQKVIDALSSPPTS